MQNSLRNNLGWTLDPSIFDDEKFAALFWSVLDFLNPKLLHVNFKRFARIVTERKYIQC